MPKILALGCSAETIAELRKDPRCEVVWARHTSDDGPATPEHTLGDPAQFDIVLHDCDDDSPPPQSIASADQDYLLEVGNSGAVSVQMVHSGQGGGIGHIGVDLYDPAGNRPPTSTTTAHPRAIHVEPFLESHTEKFEGCSISQPWPMYGGRRDHVKVVLAVDGYDKPLVVSGDEALKRLAIPHVRERNGRAAVWRDFVTRVVFAMHPDVLAGLYTSPKVVDLERERDELIRMYRTRRSEIETAIDQERSFAAKYAALPNTMDEALKALVQRALHEEFGLEIEDLDQTYPDAKNTDLYLNDHDIAIETRGSTRRNAQIGDVDGLVRQVERLKAEGRAVAGKVLIFNGQLGVAAKSRNGPFGPRVVEEAVTVGVTLINGTRLLERVMARHIGTYSTDQLVADFSKSGVVPDLQDPNKMR